MIKRSVWKLPYLHSVLLKNKYINTRKNIILLPFRNSIIPKYLENKRVRTYNGAWQLTTLIQQGMLGLKIGEFSKTKQFDKQLLSKRKSKKKTKKITQ